MFLQGLGGLVIGGRFLVAWRTAFGDWFVGGWRGGVFCLLWSWWFWGVDCVARGIRCVVRNWFWWLAGARWLLAGARGEIVCFGCWLARDVLGGARFLGAWSRLVGVDYCAGVFLVMVVVWCAVGW